MTTSTYQQALMATLSAEFAAVFGYGVVGAHVEGAARRRAVDALTWHQNQQTALRSALTAAGVADPDVPEPEPAYVLPSTVTGAASAADLARTIEDRVAGAYADLVGAANGDDRLTALQALTTCAQTATRWSGLAEAFPGLPEQS